jgi:formate dehydrogenase gamma subunit
VGVTGLPHAEKLPAVRCGSCHQDAATAIAGSVHGVAAAPGAGGCLGCHGSGHGVRRAARTGTQACSGCHAPETEQYRRSVHGVAFAHGDPEASTCRDCHGPFHSIRRHDDPRSPVSRANLRKTCARCHADRALMTRRRITIPEAYDLYAKSVHGRSTNPAAATCSDCHESHDLRRASDSSSSIYRANLPRTCGRCHTKELDAYRIGIHGQALERGVTAAPTCSDCHGEHLIRGTHDPDSPVTAASVTTTCSRCHEAQGIRETYGLPAGRLSTYQDSYHGLAARGGSAAVANCASCHGFHDILPSSDPRSAVSPRRLGETCGKCHPGAGTRFAMGRVHVATATADNPILFYVRWTYLWLIVGTIGGMALHQGLDYARKLRRHWRRHHGEVEPFEGTPRWHVRMTRSERIQHLLLLVSFFTLVGTGFALKFPEAWPFAWLARLEGGFALRSIVHRIAAVVMVGTVLVHIGYLLTKRGRGTLAALLPTLGDVREAVANFAYLLGLRRAPPAFGRFSYIEKAEYWALVWGTVVMTATGLLLWFENQSLRWLPKWALDLATLVHYYEAWLAFLAILVWHIYQNVLNPDVYPMNWTWVTGRISEEQLRHEHAAEWAQVAAAEASRDEAAGDAAPPA